MQESNNNHSSHLLEVEHLKQYFTVGGETIKGVDDVSFYVDKGEVFGLVGESGCGKTTTGRAIIRLYDATSGNVYFNGQRIVAGIGDLKDALKAAKKEGDSAKVSRLKKEIAEAEYDHKHCKRDTITKIQMIFQDPIASLNPRMTVREIISEGLVIRGVKDKDYINKKVIEVLDMVGLLPEHADRYPHEFSGGQRQRIGIARSIVMEPDIIIADEPISALDVSIQAQIINLINDLRKNMGLTILFIAHNLSVVKYFSDRIAVMYYGKIVESAPSDELFAHPLHPYTRSLLSAIPLPDPHYEKTRQRITYTPALDSDNSQEPEDREVSPGHIVRCTEKEFEKYIRELGV